MHFPFFSSVSTRARKALCFSTPVGAALALAFLNLQACSSDPAVPQDSGTRAQDGSVVVPDSGTTSDPDTGTSKADSGSDAAPLSQSEAFCAALASHGTCPDQTARPCKDNDKCLFGKMHPESAAAFNQCYASPSCKSQDTCMVEAGKAKGNAEAPNYVTVCMARSTACENAFDEEYCSDAVFAWPGIAVAASNCLAKVDCEDVKACLNALGEGLEKCP